MMKADKLREMTAEQVESQLEDAREAYFKLRFQLATGGLPDTSKLRAARREIARIATVLREFELAEAQVGVEEPEE
jgi:large subunit ribosomal protein L29